MFTSPFVYTNTQTHTNRNTKFLGGPRKESPYFITKYFKSASHAKTSHMGIL